jgi:peptidyl-prolyl cis-trans isomerase A (cyclophilin A)
LEVARRLAHEIKNPLTPIQLSAERLEHKLGPKLADSDRLANRPAKRLGVLRDLARAALLAALTGCTTTKSEATPKPAEAAKPAASEAPKTSTPAAAAAPAAALLNPAAATATAPDTYVVTLKTTKGDLVIDVNRSWAPNGADRFFNLVKVGYYDDVAFFRVVSGFMAQTGINGNGQVNTVWREARIKDDPVDPAKASNKRGYVTFATSGPDSRTTQFFINFADNDRLDGMGFSPIGKLRPESLTVLDALNAEYGEGAPRGAGPNQGRIQSEGNEYLKRDFPRLDYIQKATIQ